PRHNIFLHEALPILWMCLNQLCDEWDKTEDKAAEVRVTNPVLERIADGFLTACHFSAWPRFQSGRVSSSWRRHAAWRSRQLVGRSEEHTSELQSPDQ